MSSRDQHASRDEHEVYAELAVGYALYALEPEDEQRFLTHLSACAACERAVDEHTETLAHLAYAAEPADPPPALLEGILAGVRASGRESELTAPVSLDDARRTRASRLARPGARRGAAWVGAAAALALVGSLGVWNAALQQERADQDATVDALLARSMTLEQAVEALRGEGARTVPLAGEDGATVAVAIVHDDTMELVVEGIAANDAATSNYVLWAKDRTGAVKAVTAFDVPARAAVLEGVRLPSPGADLTRFMVTHEDGDVVPKVSSRPVLAAGDAQLPA